MISALPKVEDPRDIEIEVEKIPNSSDDPFNVDLSAEDYLDWAHFGLDGVDSVNRKNGGGIISSPSAILNGGLEWASSDDLANYRLKFLWSDGDPTAAGDTKAFVKNGPGGHQARLTQISLLIWLTIFVMKTPAT